ncbi:MAG: dephospho-CoA kinase [Lachnospiraceae bacterium]
MITLGITGGVGSGKSRVLSYLYEKYQAVVVEMDQVGRELMEPSGACYEDVFALFPEALTEDGRLDRGVIAKAVFGNPERLAALNGVIHPAVRRAVAERMAFAEKEGKPLFVMESAILLEAGYADICQDIWYVYADREVRKRRLRESRGYSDERSESVMASQLSEEEYRKGCSFVLDNSGDFEATAAEIDERLLAMLSEGLV